MAEQLSPTPMAKSTFRLPRDLYRRLKISAIQENRSMAEVLIDAVQLYLSRVESIHDE
jgi:predicted DNA-binding protein